MKAAEDFLAHQLARGLASSTVDRDRFHLRRILQLTKRGHLQLRSLSPALAARLYVESQRGATDTHRGGLAKARQFGAWCATKGWLSSNPFALVKGAGRRKRGKPQLRIEESRTFALKCLELAPSDMGAIAALTYLLLGVRASELVTREVRDLDDGGRLLWIPTSKTDAGRRVLEVPEVLRPHLLRVASQRPARAALFADAQRWKRPRDWAAQAVKRIAKLAGVSRVTPHGLRGTQATIATSAGATGQVVAAALGHTSVAITEAAYIDSGTAAAAKRRASLRVLAGGIS